MTTVRQVSRISRLSVKTEIFLGKIYDEFRTAHPAIDISHVFIQTVFCIYAFESNLFNREQVDRHLQSLPKDLVNDLRDRIDNNIFGFDWTVLNPTVLSSLVESIINPRAVHLEGIHCISNRNVHKLLDPLFLDELNGEFDQYRNSQAKLRKLQNKIAALKFFDPAFSAGIFSIETFISLRRLENKILSSLGSTDIKVSIEQFHGIELNDFAIEIADTALWIADCQMTLETSKLLNCPLKMPTLKPLKHVVCGNALTVDWKDLVPDGADYIFGAPPSVGMTHQSKQQKHEVADVFHAKRGKPYPKVGKLDYAACWFLKAAQLMEGRKTRTAFVATDSLCQSEQAQLVWQPLFERFKIHIDFAYQPFRWIEDCIRVQRLLGIIVGFSSARNNRPRFIFDGDRKIEASNINGYLLDAPNFFVCGQLVPLCRVPEIHRGNQATDGGNLIIEAKDYDEFVRREPRALKYIRRFMMGREFINNLPRWCLWLAGATDEELESMPLVAARIAAVKKFREASTFIKTRRLAKKPHLFREQITPKKFMAIPKLSSEKRQYLTIGWLDETVVAGDQLFMVEGAGLFHFGVLESSVHMAWVRALGGRFGKGYCYSKTIVYNNFVWCQPTAAQRHEIERTAQQILDVRSKYVERSLAELYKDRCMPEDLRLAHEENDRAVLSAYGFEGMTELEIVSRLMTECARLSESHARTVIDPALLADEDGIEE